jgi:hypothetical protein
MSTSLSAPAKLPDYADYVLELRSEDAHLAGEIADFTGVKEVLDWMQRRGALCHDGVDMVGQDEFEYDFLIRLGQNDRWLVFGVT